jgi:L-amino acid N-acyltransferase YncA
MAPARLRSVVVMAIREASEADWPHIYPFYRRIVGEGRTYTLPPGQTCDEARTYWLEPAPWRAVVATIDGVVVGSAKMGPNRPGRGAHVATASFMVDPDRQGEGIGLALGRHVVEWSRSTGYRAIQFNAVVETNEGAVRLWQRLGFRIIGTVPEAFDDAERGLVGLHVMYLPLQGRDHGG